MKGPMELKTKRLLLRPLSDEALAARLAEENDPGMRAALEEMLAGQPGPARGRGCGTPSGRWRSSRAARPWAASAFTARR